MSFKNTLQEYYQKKRSSLPVYNSFRKGGLDHNPKFISTLTLPDGKKFQAEGSSKKDAETKVARKAVLTLFPPQKKVQKRIWRKPPKNGKRTCILVDLENKHKMVENILDRFGSIYIDIIVFASTDHPSLLKLRESCERDRVKIVEIPCRRKDGADIGLTLYVGDMLHKDEYDTIIIVTEDHFGDTLAECVTRGYDICGYNSSPRAYCCHTTDSISKVLI